MNQHKTKVNSNWWSYAIDSGDQKIKNSLNARELTAKGELDTIFG